MHYFIRHFPETAILRWVGLFLTKREVDSAEQSAGRDGTDQLVPSGAILVKEKRHNIISYMKTAK